MTFTHLDAHGKAQMVNVTGKATTARTAVARCEVHMDNIARGQLTSDGKAMDAIRIAGEMGARHAARLIPLCHSLNLNESIVSISQSANGLRIYCTATLSGRTGVEMEALTGCSLAAMTAVAWCADHGIDSSIEGLTLVEKIGGKSGHWVNPIAID